MPKLEKRPQNRVFRYPDLMPIFPDL